MVLTARSLPLGYGTMQLTGRGVWGPPADWDAAIGLLRRAWALGVRVFDSAWYYGPEVTHRLIRQALWPYADDLVLVTKAGNSRGPDRSWVPALRPAELRAACETDLRLLGVDALPLVLLRWNPQPGDDEKFLESLVALLDLQAVGAVRSVGLSNVTPAHVDLASQVTAIAAISNSFSLTSRRDADVVAWCTAHAVPYLAYYPLLGGDVLRRPALQWVAADLRVTPAQVALAWLKAQSPMMLPIPGTRDVQHLEDNVASQRIVLPSAYLHKLDQDVRPPVPR